MSRVKKVEWMGVVLIFLLLILWELIAQSGLVFKAYFPPMTQVMQAWIALIKTPAFGAHIYATLERMSAGFGLAALAGIGLGIAMGSSKRLMGLFDPLVQTLRPLPVVALLPVAILFFGIGDTMKIGLIAFASIWPILINTIDGIQNTDDVQVQTGRVFGLTSTELVWQIRLPNAVPYIASGLRISLGIALLITITTEMVSGSNGVGFFILYSQRAFRIPEMFSGILTIALVGLILNALFETVHQRVLNWQFKQNP